MLPALLLNDKKPKANDTTTTGTVSQTVVVPANTSAKQEPTSFWFWPLWGPWWYYPPYWAGGGDFARKRGKEHTRCRGSY